MTPHPVKMVYKPVQTYRDSITVHVKADPLCSQEAVMYRMLLEMLCLQIIAEDYVQELVNIKDAKEKFRSYIKSVAYRMNDVRRKFKRKIGDSYTYMENVAVSIVDDCEPSIKWCATMIEDVLAGKIPYNEIKTAANLGMIGGILDIMMQLHKAITGKNSSDYSTAYETLRYMDRNFNFRMLNEGCEPDYGRAKESMVKMFCNIGALCKEDTEKHFKNQEQC